MSERTICRDWSPIPCDERKAARDCGDMSYVWGLGWVWWKSKDVTRPWVKCPWCDGDLPTMTGIVTYGIFQGGWDGDET
jgi:hypothetical protein